MTTYDAYRDTKPVSWIKAARKVFEAFPDAVQERASTALTIAAEGGKAAQAIEIGVIAMNENDFELVEGSGNVFRDFGDTEADLKQAKAVVAARIIAALDNRGLSVRKAAALTRFAAADFSRVRNANLRRFTLDRLMKMLATLDADVKVTIRIGGR